MPGDASDRGPALGLFWSVVLCGLAALATFQPDDATPVASTFHGIPRLVLYGVAGVLLAATGTRAALAAADEWRAGAPAAAPRRATAWLAAWLLLAAAVGVFNALRLRDDIAAPFGPGLWAASMACVVVAVVPVWRAEALRRWRPRRPTRFEGAVAALLLFAALLRFVDLDGVPPNVQADEGDRAASALDVLDGTAPPSWFDSGWFYVNMVYFRALAGFFDVFGTGVSQGRALNALAGVVLVGAVAWIGFRHFGRRVGFVATALAAASPFALQFSRTIAESGVGAALFAVSLAGFVEGGRSGRPWPFAVAGLAGGVSLYTYASARAWPLAAGAAVAVLLALAPERRAAILRGAAVAAVAAVVAALPYAVHLSQHPDEATLRFEQTSVLEPINRTRLTYVDEQTPLPQVLVLQLERSFGLFDRYPDGSDFLPTGNPVLPGLLAALTLLGVFFALGRSRRDPRLALLTIWFWIGLSGVLLTVETPAGQRAAALVVTLPLLAAVAIVEIASRVPILVRFVGSPLGTAPGPTELPSSGRRTRLLADGVVAVAVAGLVYWQLWTYFVDYANRTEPWAGPTTEGREVARLGQAGPVYALEREHAYLRAGWVRFLGRDARKGGVAYPGRQLPLLQPDDPAAEDPRLAIPLPSPDDTITFLLSARGQRSYLGYLRDLYPGGIVRPTADGRLAVRVPPRAAGRETGVRVVRDGRLVGTVSTFGELPANGSAGGALTWRGGIRVAQSGYHRFSLTAPAGASLAVDGVTVATTPRGGTVTGAVAVPAGLHLVAVRAPVSSAGERVELAWSGRLLAPTPRARLRPFRREQTYAALGVPRGLTVEVVTAGPLTPGIPRVQRWLDTSVAADFTTIRDRLPLTGRITWRGVLVVPRSGTYGLGVLSDGAVRFAIDGRRIDLDRARRRGIVLRAGEHPVRVTLPLGEPRPSYVRWVWNPPGAGGWSVVPASVLRPLGAVRIVEPARPA